MSGSVDLGVIRTGVELDMRNVRQGMSELRSHLREMATGMESASEEAGRGAGERLGAGIGSGFQAKLGEVARQMSQNVRSVVREAQAAIFEMTHDGAASERLKAHLGFERDREAGVPLEMAQKRRDLRLQAADEEERRRLSDLREARLSVGYGRFEKERFSAQKAFDRTVGESENPTIRGEAALLYQARIQEILRRQTEAMFRAIAPGMARGSAAFSTGAGDLMNGFEEERRQRGLGMLSAGFRQMRAQQERERARETEARKEMQEQERLRAFEYRTGSLSLQSYRGFLEQRLRALEEFSPEWRRVYESLYKLDQETLRKMGAQFKTQGRENSGYLAQGLGSGSGVVRDALATLMSQGVYGMGRSLRRGVNSIFGDVMIRSLTNLLANTLEGALASVFRKKRKQEKKSGFLDGLLGSALGVVGGFFGFDDAANDSRARTWGWDFARHFSSGMDSFRARGGRDAAISGVGAGATNHITVDIRDVTVSHEVDLRAFEERIAWSVQQALRRSV